MDHPTTRHTGPLGSTIHILSADAGTAITGASKGLRTTRLRGRNDPPGTGMEPDCAFYVGERARCYRAALADGEAAAETFFERTPPDLVVEAEIASIDEGKIARYGEMGVRELWRLHGRKGSRDLRVEFIGLRPGTAPCRLDASEVLGALTPDEPARSRGRHATRPDPRRAHRHRGAYRAPPATRQRARARSGGALRDGPLRMTTALVVRHVIIFGYGHGLQRAIIDE